jgi:tetratricopeptide (TPR) repeat protein
MNMNRTNIFRNVNPDESGGHLMNVLASWIKAIMFFILLMTSASVFGQAERKYIREGNALYDDKKYAEGEIAYRKALDKKQGSYDAAFNVGTTLYKQGKYLDAATQFGGLTESTKDKDKLAKLYYNLGNSYLKADKLEECVKAYQNSLLNNPGDKDTKFNLSYAMRKLQQQKQQNKQDQNKKDQNKDKKDKDKQNQDKNDQQQKQQQNQDKQGKQGEKQISPEDAQRMLDAVQNDEKNLKKKMEEEKASSEKVKVLKNW